MQRGIKIASKKCLRWREHITYFVYIVVQEDEPRESYEGRFLFVRAQVFW